MLDDNRDDEIDATKDAVDPSAPSALIEPEEGYDPARDRETKRGNIAVALVALMFLIVMVSLLYLVFSPKPDVSALKSVLDIIFAPVVGLVGAVTGFYFGEKHR